MEIEKYVENKTFTELLYMKIYNSYIYGMKNISLSDTFNECQRWYQRVGLNVGVFVNDFSKHIK